MAEKDMGMKMGSPSCEWVRARLPLLVGDGEDAPGEGGDLSSQDRRRIERHMVECATCRQHRTALQGVLTTLTAVAARPPISPAAPSLWPLLEHQIKTHRSRSRSKWFQVLHRFCPPKARAAAERLYRGCDQVWAELPLHLAWTRDSVRELLDARFRGAISRPERGLDMRLDNLLPVLGLGLAAAVLMVLLLLPLLYHPHAQPGARIAAKTAPIGKPAVATAESSNSSDASLAGLDAIPGPSPALAQTDTIAAAETPAPGSVATTKPSGYATSSTPAPAIPRYGFDLEHGIPMPPDARGAKPAY
jgi:hypothetical protein